MYVYMYVNMFVCMYVVTKAGRSHERILKCIEEVIVCVYICM